MIFVERSAPAPAPLLELGAVESEKVRRTLVAGEGTGTGYGTQVPKMYRRPDIRRALAGVFRDKCAFCESRLSFDDLRVVHFRPMHRCVDQDGSFFPLHYWWLANDWSNLYAACRDCGRAKSNRFPIAGERALLEEEERDVEALFSRERPLLIDPCREGDEPESHLVYTEDGRVASDTERGRITIELFALNRAGLVEARRRTLSELEKHFAEGRSLLSGPEPPGAYELRDLQDDVESMSRPQSPFAGMCRQFSRDPFDRETAEALRTTEESLRGARSVTPAQREKVAAEFSAFRERQKYTLRADEVTSDYYLKSRTVERIVLQNIRPIRELTIEVGGDAEVPWLMLLGDNGSGKSSVLKSLALALMGRRYRESLRLSVPDYLRRGTDEGRIEVHLSGTEEPIGLTLEKGRPAFSGGESPQVLLLAYGATRLLPRRESPSHGTRYARVDNLFDPFTPLADARRWLLALPPERFESVKPALLRLLDLSPEDDLVRNPAEEAIDVRLFGDTVRLDQLSDGYQTVVALAAEIMSILLDRWQDLAAAEGIVLVDEIGSHLHPSWKLKIVSSLRSTFPSVQFIVTSHDPLCLRGMRQGEVVVMERDDKGRVLATTDLPNPEAMRVDQILQSDFFGLHSTVDDEVNRLYVDYRRLLSVKDRSPEQEAELAAIRRRVADHSVLGDDERERRLLEALDEYVAERKAARGGSRPEGLKKETRRHLADLWRKTRRGPTPTEGEG